MARRLRERAPEVVEANASDLRRAEREGVAGALFERLRFGPAKLEARAGALEAIADLPDPLGRVVAAERRPIGLDLARVRVPLGVILMVYEARPHVTVNAAALCLKAGNAAILRGGSEAADCNRLLGDLWAEALGEAGLPTAAVQVVGGSHEDVARFLGCRAIDLVIARGGKPMVRAITERSRIPVLCHLDGICHVYVDEGADPGRAARIAIDSKCLMPAVCNAMETLLVHRSLLPAMPGIAAAFRDRGVVVRGCEATRDACPAGAVEPATEEDWSTEYLDRIVSVRVVGGVDEAIDHINTYGSGHTDAIVTDSVARAGAFTRRVDSAVVLVNASTMFCDGASLGMGAEIGISTSRWHARGPMGPEELTSTKFVLRGEGLTMGDLGP